MATAATTSVATGGAGDVTILASKRAIYVGGLAAGVTPQLLRATMIPFGDIKSVDIVRSYPSLYCCQDILLLEYDAFSQSLCIFFCRPLN